MIDISTPPCPADVSDGFAEDAAVLLALSPLYDLEEPLGVLVRRAIGRGLMKATYCRTSALRGIAARFNWMMPWETNPRSLPDWIREPVAALEALTRVLADAAAGTHVYDPESDRPEGEICEIEAGTIASAPRMVVGLYGTPGVSDAALALASLLAWPELPPAVCALANRGLGMFSGPPSPALMAALSGRVLLADLAAAVWAADCDGLGARVVSRADFLHADLLGMVNGLKRLPDGTCESVDGQPTSLRPLRPIPALTAGNRRAFELLLKNAGRPVAVNKLQVAYSPTGKTPYTKIAFNLRKELLGTGLEITYDEDPANPTQGVTLIDKRPAAGSSKESARNRPERPE